MRYRLLRRLGKGGMAEVYEAIAVGSSGFERRVAVKRILPEAAGDPSFRRMFLDEARIASSLHHAGIVAIVDFGLADGLPFQVLEFVDGEDLQALARRGTRAGRPLPLGVALHVCREVAHALHHAHTATDARGQPLHIVHRDVSPSNVLISRSGDVKLSDFGIALAATRTEKTEVGVVKGKRSYMAPEQVLGQPAGPYTDVFALGCVLHWALAGSSPLRHPDALEELLARGSLPLSEKLPEPARRIVERATRRRPEERFGSALEMADALGEACREVGLHDGRAALLQWLGELPPPPEPSEPSTGTPVELLELVRDERADAPTFAARPVRRPPEGEARTEAAGPGARSEQREPGPDEPRGARRLPRLGAAALTLGLAAGLWWLARPEPPPLAARREEAPAPSSPGASSPADPETTGTEAAWPEAPAALAPAEPPPIVGDRLDASPAPGDGEKGEAPRSRQGRERRPPRRKRAAAAASTAPSGREASGSAREAPKGYLWVGGTGSINLTVLVDGGPRGRAPRRIELPVGTHEVRLVDDAGAVVASRQVAILETHTRRKPLRWNLRTRPTPSEGERDVAP